MEHQAANDPTLLFLESLTSAIASKKAYVSDMNGNAPDNAVAWGWRELPPLNGEWSRPTGTCIGWKDNDDLFLDSLAAYAVIQAIGRDGGDTMMISRDTLHKRLDERGFLKDRETARGRYTVRKRIEGYRRNVLHLKASSLLEADQPDQSDQEFLRD